jgi:hypothetical protein
MSVINRLSELRVKGGKPHAYMRLKADAKPFLGLMLRLWI